jgi:hypothetical protein
VSDQNHSEDKSLRQRYWLAMTVLGVSAAGIIGLAFIGLCSTCFEWERKDLFDKIFAALIPLFGTWVGTILTFYFTRENFDAANRSMQQMVKQLTPDERLKSIAVKTAMIPRNKMVVQTVADNNDAAVHFDALQAMLRPPVTRIPVLNSDDSPRYVVHESMIYKFVAEHSVPATGFVAAQHTLADLVADPTIGPMIKLFGLVSVNGTLADAKREMEKVPGAQDVFVTEDGSSNKPVLGWLTNVDITTNLNAPPSS